jgi:hypothetical protein
MKKIFRGLIRGLGQLIDEKTRGKKSHDTHCSESKIGFPSIERGGAISFVDTG